MVLLWKWHDETEFAVTLESVQDCTVEYVAWSTKQIKEALGIKFAWFYRF